jgi:hypothetical protein
MDFTGTRTILTALDIALLTGVVVSGIQAGDKDWIEETTR